MVLLDPKQKRPRVVKAQLHAGMLLDHGQKCIVRGLIALFKNVLEVPGRLMCVDNQDKVEWRAQLSHQVHIP